MPKRSSPTLIKPFPPDPNHSPIESILSLLPLTDIGPDIYTNARPLWHPPGARGIFGGAAIAQCLAAAQATIPPDFTIHSMHCYFVLAGNSSIPILYHVERVRDGKSFATRTVQARQRGKPIFTTTMSFAREESGGRPGNLVEHQVPMPTDVVPPPNGVDHRDEKRTRLQRVGSVDDTPFESVRCAVPEGGKPESKRLRQWIRARGRISDTPIRMASEDAAVTGDPTEAGIMRADGSEQQGVVVQTRHNHQAHLSALAYMSDSWFIGTVARVHNLTRFENRRKIDKTVAAFSGSDKDKKAVKDYLEAIAKEEAEENAQCRPGRDTREVGMMVSLDHLIFFHNPRAFRADEWMLTEMESPWAGDGRGLVLQRVWTKDGILIATCVQEGVVRLVQGTESKL
jgi:acyl-CoA thioesterase II